MINTVTISDRKIIKLIFHRRSIRLAFFFEPLRAYCGPLAKL
jgi:hypothetical protein